MLFQWKTAKHGDNPETSSGLEYFHQPSLYIYENDFGM